MINVGIWIRVSTEDQAKGDSPQNHQTRARLYAELKKWNIVDIYDLSGVSGKSVIEHPETRRMLQDVASGKIQALIFSKLARLVRNVKELLEISEHFEKHKANLVSLDESIDTSTPAGRLLFTVIGALAQWEREEISSRVSASIPVRAKLGKPTGGRGPLGYRWVNKQLVPNPEEAPVVQRAFELFFEKKKLMPTCNALTEEGLRAKKSRFRPVTLKRILTDPTYKGLKRANYTRSKGNKKSWILKPESDWVYHQVEPVVSPELWNSVNNIIKNWQVKYQKHVPRESKYPFGGLLVCECGAKMYVHRYSGMEINRYVCQKCRNKVNEDIVIQQFLEGLKTVVVKPEQLNEMSKSETDIKKLEERLDHTRRELQGVNEKIDKLLETWYKGLVDKVTFSERFDKLKERRNQLTLEVPKIQGEFDFVKISELGKDYVMTKAESFSSMWPLLNEGERINLISELLDNVKVGKDNLTFTYFYLPAFMAVEKDNRNLRGSLPPPT